MSIPVVASLSGGKDSVAMVLRWLELGNPLDAMIWFDGGWDFPEIVATVRRVKRETGVPLLVAHPTRGGREVTFDYMLYEYQKTKGVTKGNIGYGWQHTMRRWCTREKIDALGRIARQYDNRISLIGYAADEASRVANNQNETRSGVTRHYPLIEWGWTEADALEYCYSRGYDFGGLYRHFRRVSCWCCPLQGIGELRNLWKHFPEYWARLVEMDARSMANNGGLTEDRPDIGFKHNRRGYGPSVLEWQRRFEDDERQQTFDWEGE